MTSTAAFAPAIEVEGVARSFGDVHAVRDASFTVQPGSVTALIGPNGSGKTTLLLMLATLLRPDAGTIRIAGHDPVADPRAVRQAMGWMPDVLGSWGTVTVRRALEVTGRLYELTPEQARARASALIELVGLQELADRPSRVLSRGQKQRLSLARALVHEPRVLLLDEPASGLDPAARVELRAVLRKARRHVEQLKVGGLQVHGQQLKRPRAAPGVPCRAAVRPALRAGPARPRRRGSNRSLDRPCAGCAGPSAGTRR